MSSGKFIKISFLYFLVTVFGSFVFQTILMSSQLETSLWRSLGIGMVYWLADCLFYIYRHCNGGE